MEQENISFSNKNAVKKRSEETAQPYDYNGLIYNGKTMYIDEGELWGEVIPTIMMLGVFSSYGELFNREDGLSHKGDGFGNIPAGGSSGGGNPPEPEYDPYTDN